MQILRDDRYSLEYFKIQADFLNYVERKKQQLDCLILQSDLNLSELFVHLSERTILLPVVVLDTNPIPSLASSMPSSLDGTKSLVDFSPSYHTATLRLSLTQLGQISISVNQAINNFLDLTSDSQNPSSDMGSNSAIAALQDNLLLAQQRRLAEKLRERLGYLGVYYKRNPASFFRHMTRPQKQELLRQLKAEYRKIILTYFSSDPDLNELIDNFVNLAFFADISVTQIMEIHMELMDEFSKQLKLEGRSDEIILDYRLTLIDTIAHLCEMYRRSIPRES